MFIHYECARGDWTLRISVSQFQLGVTEGELTGVKSYRPAPHKHVPEAA